MRALEFIFNGYKISHDNKKHYIILPCLMTGIKVFLVRPVSYVSNNLLYFERVFLCLEQEKKNSKI